MKRAVPLPACALRCACPQCAELDFSFPGEGVQLALVLNPPRPARHLAGAMDEVLRKAQSV